MTLHCKTLRAFFVEIKPVVPHIYLSKVKAEKSSENTKYEQEFLNKS